MIAPLQAPHEAVFAPAAAARGTAHCEDRPRSTDDPSTPYYSRHSARLARYSPFGPARAVQFTARAVPQYG